MSSLEVFILVLAQGFILWGVYYVGWKDGYREAQENITIKLKDK